MNQEMYRELQKALLDKQKQADDKHRLIGRFLDALVQSANDAAGQERGIKVCAWGTKATGTFVEHHYEETKAGFNFELQVSIYDSKRTPIFRGEFPFSATLSHAFIEIVHESESRRFPKDEMEEEHHHKGVLEMLDASLKETILGPSGLEASDL